MAQIQLQNSTNNYNLHRANPNFGNKLSEIADILTEENYTGKSDEEFKADKFQKLADLVKKEEKAPSAIKSFAVVGALSAVSALTAATISGRFFNFIHTATPAMNVLGRNAKKGLDKAIVFINEKVALNEVGLKGKTQKATQKVLNWLDSVAKKGAEKDIKEITNRTKDEIKVIKDKIKADIIKKTGNKRPLAKEIQTVYDEQVTKEINEKVGSNLLKKAVKTTAGTTAGITALKKATIDENKDGIPDVVQKKDAGKNATEQVTAAIIDCALDSCGI